MDKQLAIKASGQRFGFNRRVRTVIISIFLLGIIIGIFIAGIFIGDDAMAVDFTRKGIRPSWEYPFGTDWLGRNMLLRTVKGLSISIMVGTVASAVSAVLATIIGIAAAMGSKWTGQRNRLAYRSCDGGTPSAAAYTDCLCMWTWSYRPLNRYSGHPLDGSCQAGAGRGSSNSKSAIHYYFPSPGKVYGVDFAAPHPTPCSAAICCGTGVALSTCHTPRIVPVVFRLRLAAGTACYRDYTCREHEVSHRGYVVAGFFPRHHPGLNRDLI